MAKDPKIVNVVEVQVERLLEGTGLTRDDLSTVTSIANEAGVASDSQVARFLELGLARKSKTGRVRLTKLGRDLHRQAQRIEREVFAVAAIKGLTSTLGVDGVQIGSTVYVNEEETGER